MPPHTRQDGVSVGKGKTRCQDVEKQEPVGCRWGCQGHRHREKQSSGSPNRMTAA